MKFILTLLISALLIPTTLFAQQPRIINGSKASAGEWPWMAALIQSNTEPSSLVTGHFCGGVLIAPQYVLTAAHCAELYAAGGGFLPEDLFVALGKTNLNDTTGEIIGVESVVTHPDYDRNLLLNDLAIIKLKTASSITPLSLIGAGEESYWDDESPASVVGWGKINPVANNYPDALYDATIPVQSDQDCADSLGRFFDPNAHTCAGVLSSTIDAVDGVDACSGDSGGPLVVDVAGTWKLIGLVSFGIGNCGGSTYGAYTRVGSYLGWILSFPTTAPESDSTAPTLRYNRDGICDQAFQTCSFSVTASDASSIATANASYTFRGQKCRNTKAGKVCRKIVRKGFAFNSVLISGSDTPETQIYFDIFKYYGKGTFTVSSQVYDYWLNSSKVLKFSFKSK